MRAAAVLSGKVSVGYKRFDVSYSPTCMELPRSIIRVLWKSMCI
jgi:hypothetical protein